MAINMMMAMAREIDMEMCLGMIVMASMTMVRKWRRECWREVGLTTICSIRGTTEVGEGTEKAGKEGETQNTEPR